MGIDISLIKSFGIFPKKLPVLDHGTVITYWKFMYKNSPFIPNYKILSKYN